MINIYSAESVAKNNALAEIADKAIDAYMDALDRAASGEAISDEEIGALEIAADEALKAFLAI